MLSIIPKEVLAGLSNINKLLDIGENNKKENNNKKFFVEHNNDNNDQDIL